MKRVWVLSLLLTSCVSSHYYTPLGDECTAHWIWPAFAWKDCQKGERTGNINLNMNQPQHDPATTPHLQPAPSAWRDARAEYPRVIGKNIRTVILAVGKPTQVTTLQDGDMSYLYNFPDCAIDFGTTPHGRIFTVLEAGACPTTSQ